MTTLPHHDGIPRDTTARPPQRVSLARASLRHDWRRYLAALLALTFAGLLVIVQLALLLGMFGTVSAVVDQSTASLWIGYRNTPSVDLGRPLSRFADVPAWQHPAVTRGESYTMAFGDLRRRDGVPVSVVLNGIDPRSSALAYARLLAPAQRAALADPDAILIDEADKEKIGAAIGERVEINGRLARIAGFVRGIRAIGGVNVLASHATLRRLAPDSAEQTTFRLLALAPGADAARVAKEIADRARFPRYSVWVADDLSARSQIYWLLESGAGIGTAFASALALVVGMVITSQTLSAAILASLKEFATLRALGIAAASLRREVIEQSLWIGVAGLLLAALLVGAIALLGDALHIAMRFPPWMLLGSASLMVAIAVVSGLLALRPLNAADPANLLR